MRRSHSKDYGPVQGVVMVQLKDVMNTMKDHFQRTRVSEEVSTEGKLGRQALVLDVEGKWREFTGVVNTLAAKHLKVRSIAKVTKAVALGDLNGCSRLRALAAEVARVTLELGSQSKLGGQVHVSDVEGNVVESGAAHQVRSIAVVTTAVARGDLTQKVEIFVEGEMSTLEGTVNSMVDQLSAFASEVTRVALEVGRQGILGGQARVEGVQGTLADLTRNVNKMALNLTDQVRSISDIPKTIALGDLDKFVNVDLSVLANNVTRILELEEIVNGMTESLSVFAGEVTRVAREVGTEGRLGGQARFTKNVSGTWKDLTDNVNLMANNLTLQARTIAVLKYTLCTTGVQLKLKLLNAQVQDVARVPNAVARGVLIQKITVPVQGVVMVQLKDVMNTMKDNFQRTRVSEVGIEGQALVIDVEGTGRELTGVVNNWQQNISKFATYSLYIYTLH
ncbi:hypothetical protein BYT27DRAFT_7253623 [Phlegmacium glaucopus]|nr:hypothetical protein BYT27DRAFT_7253623 [Phlegmacium glaucopus]